MSWGYNITDHAFKSPDGFLTSSNIYSGAFGDSQNNPTCCNLVDVGPIPTGNWKLTGLEDDPKTGPDTIVLAPADVATLNAIQQTGRDPFSFRIHGDDIADPGHGSDGCIVAPRAIRMVIWDSGDRDLVVTS